MAKLLRKLVTNWIKKMHEQKENTEQDHPVNEANQTGQVQGENEESTRPENNASTEIEDLRKEVQEANDKYLRLYSEFDNYRKRVNRERLELIKSAGTEIISSLLPILDDFERAKKSLETATDIEPAKEGVELIYNKLKSVLEQKGLKEMNTVGEAFDSEFHDAITNAPAPSDEMKGKVIEELQRGYYMNDKVIRHAKVIVGQ